MLKVTNCLKNLGYKEMAIRLSSKINTLLHVQPHFAGGDGNMLMYVEA